jgi:hypothetical protein
MSAAAAGSEDTAGKRQKKEESALITVDLDGLPDDFKVGITVADGPLALTQGVRSIEALVSKHHQAVHLYRRVLTEQAENQAKLDARLKAMETALPVAAKQHATEAKDLAGQASVTADLADQRVSTLTAQLNEYATAMEFFEKNQQEVLSKHLQTIETTFLECDEILTEVKMSVAAAGPASLPALGGVPATPQQDLAALRGHVDGLAAAIQATSAQAKEAEDAVVLSRVQINELTAWSSNSNRQQLARVVPTDAKLREELMTEFKLVRSKFDYLEAGLCKCPQGCPGQKTKSAPQQSATEPDRFLLSPGEGADASALKLPFMSGGR